MKKVCVLASLAGILSLGLAQPASAQVIPNVRGLSAHSVATNFMSLPGYVRWQYFLENNVWISWNEAQTLVSAQQKPS